MYPLRILEFIISSTKYLGSACSVLGQSGDIEVIEAAQVLLLQGSQSSGKVRSSLAVMNHRTQSRDGGGTGRGQMGKLRAVGAQMRGLIQERGSECFMEGKMAKLSSKG